MVFSCNAREGVARFYFISLIPDLRFRKCLNIRWRCRSWAIVFVVFLKACQIKNPCELSQGLRNLWFGAESNRRHKDFQSFALPTELPNLKRDGKIRHISGFYKTTAFRIQPYLFFKLLIINIILILIISSLKKRMQALSGMIGRKGSAGGYVSLL